MEIQRRFEAKGHKRSYKLHVAPPSCWLGAEVKNDKLQSQPASSYPQFPNEISRHTCLIMFLIEIIGNYKN